MPPRESENPLSLRDIFSRHTAQSGRYARGDRDGRTTRTSMGGTTTYVSRFDPPARTAHATSSSQRADVPLGGDSRWVRQLGPTTATARTYERPSMYDSPTYEARRARERTASSRREGDDDIPDFDLFVFERRSPDSDRVRREQSRNADREVSPRTRVDSSGRNEGTSSGSRRQSNTSAFSLFGGASSSSSSYRRREGRDQTRSDSPQRDDEGSRRSRRW